MQDSGVEIEHKAIAVHMNKNLSFTYNKESQTELPMDLSRISRQPSVPTVPIG
jgi:hypothetical protein